MTVKNNKEIIAMYKKFDFVADFSALEPDIVVTAEEWFLNIYNNSDFYKDGFYKIFNAVREIIKEVNTDLVSHEVFIAPAQLMPYQGKPIILPRLIFNQAEDSDSLKKENAVAFLDHILNNYDNFWDLFILTILILISDKKEIMSSTYINKNLHIPKKNRIILFLLLKLKLLINVNDGSEIKELINKSIGEVSLGFGGEVRQLKVPFKLKPTEISFNETHYDIDPKFKSILLREDFTKIKTPLISNPPIDYKSIVTEILGGIKNGLSYEESIKNALIKL